jgi:RsiW-degrading membrane proteinase PrsW (M82 family)
MTSNVPQHDPSDGPGFRPPARLWQERNPTWMGQVQDHHYRAAPEHPAGGSHPGPQPALASALRSAALPAPGGRSAGVVLLVAGGGALAFAGLFLVLPYLLANTGLAGFVVGFVASLIPLTAVLLAVFVIDRWEPEPKRLLVFAFIWGAVVSVAATLVIQPVFAMVAAPPPGVDYRTFALTVQAPVVEEFAKSLGLLLLLLLARKHFDGPVDGVVFAFTIAGGFAFTENILYFGSAIAQSSTPGADLAVAFFLRGVMSPFAHAIFTGSTGLILGLAARRWRVGLTLGAFIVGLVPAMILHSTWNSMGQDFLAQYVLVQVPIFLLAAAVVALLRVAESRLTRQRLTEYAAAGWFTPAEVSMLATGRGRRQAVRWAKSFGHGAQMKSFVGSATELAFIRQRILSGRNVAEHQRDEQQQLRRIAADRDALLH